MEENEKKKEVMYVMYVGEHQQKDDMGTNLPLRMNTKLPNFLKHNITKHNFLKPRDDGRWLMANGKRKKTIGSRESGRAREQESERERKK